MPDAVELNLVDAEISLDLDTGNEVTLDIVDSDITLEVVGQVGPRGIQGEQGIQGIQGIQGEVGPVGPVGPPGVSSGFYRHNQAAPAAQWMVLHDLNYPPAITVVDSAGTQLFPDITYLDDFTIQIDHSYPVAGFAYCT